MTIEKEKSYKSNNDEIDIYLIFKFFLRNKFFISYFSIFFFVSSALFSLTLKRVWEGQFQIVLNSENTTKNINPSLTSFLKIDQDNNLKTQVGILKSPSILMPVYDIAKKNSILSSSNKLIFSKWKNKLAIELEKDTSILNISYRDSNRDAILPILEKMTTTYQDYSGRNRKRELDLTTNYLLGQINIFKTKSEKSLKRLQEFATDQDLIVLDYKGPNAFTKTLQDTEYLIKEESEFDGSSIPNIGIENIRVNSANEIRQIDSQIEKILEIGDDYKKLQYIGSTIPALVEEGIPSTLSKIEKDLAELRTRYRDTDEIIIKKISERDSLIKLLRQQAIGYLNARKLRAKSIMESAMRPKGILLKYKELIRQAKRDESTLISLENQLRAIDLEQSRLEDPWELITKPTLLKESVGPSRSKLALLGLFAGFLVSSLIAIFKEYKSGKIYDKNGFEKVLLAPFLDFLNVEKKSLNNKELSIFLEYIRSKKEKKLSFISLNKSDYTSTEILKNYILKEQKGNIEIDLINPYENINQCITSDLQIFFASLENVKYSEINDLKNKFKILNIYLEGFFLFRKRD